MVAVVPLPNKSRANGPGVHLSLSLAKQQTNAGWFRVASSATIHPFGKIKLGELRGGKTRRIQNNRRPPAAGWIETRRGCFFLLLLLLLLFLEEREKANKHIPFLLKNPQVTQNKEKGGVGGCMLARGKCLLSFPCQPCVGARTPYGRACRDQGTGLWGFNRGKPPPPLDCA